MDRARGGAAGRSEGAGCETVNVDRKAAWLTTRGRMRRAARLFASVTIPRPGSAPALTSTSDALTGRRWEEERGWAVNTHAGQTETARLKTECSQSQDRDVM